jgi:hypothetical protein
MPENSLTAQPICRSSRELLPKMLHQLAQPVSALRCSLEVALGKTREIQGYVEALENAQEIASHLQQRLEYFRDLAEVVEPGDCLSPVAAESIITTAVDEVRELAESLDTNLEVACKATAVFGNEQKLLIGVLRLLDSLIANQQPTTVQFIAEDEIFGTVSLRTEHRGSAKGVGRESMTIAETALVTMGGEIHYCPVAEGLLAEVRLLSYRHPAATTSAIMGDF